MIDYDKINLNEYALKLRRDGKTFKQIGDELGVSLSLIHISEPTRPLYISYAVFCLKK